MSYKNRTIIDIGYKFSDYEKTLKRINKLKRLIKNPSPRRLLITQKQLEKRYDDLCSGTYGKQVLRYEQIKQVIEEKSNKLISIKCIDGGKLIVGYWKKGDCNNCGLPRIYFGCSGLPVFSGPMSYESVSVKDLIEILPDRFMETILNLPTEYYNGGF